MTPQDLARFADAVYKASDGLVRLAPDDRWSWKPPFENAMTLGQLCRHMADATGAPIRGFVTGEWGPPPEGGEMLPPAEKMPVCSKEEALRLLEEDRLLMHEMLDNLPAEEFDGRAVSAPWGGEAPLWSYCLQMVEHLIAHKMQLFQYLKLLGLPVSTKELYGM